MPVLRRFVFCYAVGILVLPACITPPAAARELYVEPGSGTQGSGSIGNPFRSIHRAVEQVRAVNDGTEDIVVYLRGGYHFLDSSLVLREEDGGNNGHTVTYRAYEDEFPVISGAKVVTGWEPVGAGDSLQWRARCTLDKKIRAAWIFDKPAYMACGPTVEAAGGWGDYNGKPEGFHTDRADLLFSNPRDAEVLRTSNWTVHQICIEDLNPEGAQGVLKMQQPIWYVAQSLRGGGSPASAVSGHSYLLRNAREFLDSPGEFYFDRAEHYLYYIPHEDVDMHRDAVLFAARVEGLLKCTGTSSADKVSHVVFEGIAFQHDSYLLPRLGDSRGYMTLQGPEAVVTPPISKNSDNGLLIQGSCELMFAEHIRFERCRFEHCGGTGVNLVNGVTECDIVGNIFRDLGACAVIVGHPEHVDLSSINADIPLPFLEGGEELCRNNRITDNLIREVSLDLAHCPPLSLFSTEAIEVSHNDIGTAGYTAVSLGWGWSKEITTQKNNTIHANRTNAPVQYFNDGGHIYSLSPNPGTVVDSNFNYDSGMSVVPLYLRAAGKEPHAVFCPGHGGLYPDEATSGVTYRGNVYEGLCRQWGSWCCAEENTFVGNRAVEGRGLGDIGTNNGAYPLGERPEAVRNIISRSGLREPYRDLHESLTRRPPSTAISILDNRTRNASRTTVRIENAGSSSPTVSLTLPAAARVHIDLLDPLGRVRAVVHDDRLPAGFHRTTPRMKPARGGFFLLRIRTGEHRTVMPMVLVGRRR